MTEYVYLSASTASLSLALLIILLYRRQWRIYAASAACCIPFAFTSHEFIPEYWNPKLALPIYMPSGAFLTSGEDIMLTAAFAVFTVFWMLLLNGPGVITRGWKACAMHYAWFAFLGYIASKLATMFIWGQQGIMLSFSVGVAVMMLPVVWLCRQYAGRTLLSALAFTAVYVVFMHTCRLLWPGFMDNYNLSSMLQQEWMGVPIMEIPWALGFGFGWPMLMIQVLGLSRESEL